MQLDWRVECIFYDRLFKDKYHKGFLYRKILNRFRTLEERKGVIETWLIEIPKLFEEKDVPDGTDLADMYLESRMNNKPVKTQKQLTKTEIAVKRLAWINPEIINLIRTFDLLDNEHNEIKSY